jgi:hypothetical protein
MTHIITLSLLLLLFTTTILAATAPSVPWFREKYLKEYNNGYYIYTFSRWRLDDNDIDVCPELHTPAVYFAMTGRKLWNNTPLTHATYRQRQREERRRRRRRLHEPEYDPLSYYTQPIAYYLLWFEITVQDVVWFLIDFTLYCCELLILLLSVLMASLTTMILCILVFAQY